MGNEDEERVNLLSGYQTNSNSGGVSAAAATSYSASAPNYQDGIISYQDSAPPYDQINNQFNQRPPPGPYYNPQYTTIPVPILPQVILVGGCPCCRVGVLEDDYSCLGIMCAILFFPLGVLCCLATKQRRCSNCGAIYG